MIDNLEGLRDPMGMAPGLIDLTQPHSLPQTTALLNSLRLTARAEMTERGYDTDVYTNPIDSIMRVQHPFFRRLSAAVDRAATDSAFAPPPSTFTEGTRVRILPIAADEGWIEREFVGRVGIVRPHENPTEIRIRLDAGGSAYLHAEHLELE